MNVLERFRSLFFVERCFGCGTRIGRGERFCAVCRAEYEAGRQRCCATCGKRLSECDCAPGDLVRNRVRRLYKILPYRPGDTENGVNRMLYHIKHDRPMDAVRFCAAELAEPLRGKFRAEDGWRVTYAPRSRGAKGKYGYDHGEELARALARELGLPFAGILGRRSGKEQKHRNRDQRRENIAGAFVCRRRADVADRSFLLFDDIVTTGATMAEAAQTLYVAGAHRVVGVCLAVTLHS